MPGLNIGTSVLKREMSPISKVESRLLSKGWSKTGSAMGGRLRYYENAGFNITALEGPRGTVIFPSGPIRGVIFGENAVVASQTSAIGTGAKTKADEGKDIRNEGKARQMT